MMKVIFCNLVASVAQKFAEIEFDENHEKIQDWKKDMIRMKLDVAQIPKGKYVSRNFQYGGYSRIDVMKRHLNAFI